MQDYHHKPSTEGPPDGWEIHCGTKRLKRSLLCTNYLENILGYVLKDGRYQKPGSENESKDEEYDYTEEFINNKMCEEKGCHRAGRRHDLGMFVEAGRRH